jgi:uncharacterized protein (DUF302 family)
MGDDAHEHQGSTSSGTVSVSSTLTFAQTLERLEGAIKAAGLSLFAVVDHSGGAHEAGLSMRDTTLLVFGNPRAGTPAMVASPLLALELPLKALVWVDEGGQVRVSYQDPTVEVTHEERSGPVVHRREEPGETVSSPSP